MKMSDNWNDDDRDTSVSVSTCYRLPQNDVIHPTSVCDVMREFYKDQRESQYTWTIDDYEDEVKRRLKQAYMPVFFHSKFVPSQAMDMQSEPVQTDIQNTQEDCIDEEVEQINDDILEKQIYKKCWYS